MALGPDSIQANLSKRIADAEAMIDRMISSWRKKTIQFDARGLNIKKLEFDSMLRQKYISAGWSKVEWIDPIDYPGEFGSPVIQLSA